MIHVIIVSFCVSGPGFVELLVNEGLKIVDFDVIVHVHGSDFSLHDAKVGTALKTKSLPTGWRVINALLTQLKQGNPSRSPPVSIGKTINTILKEC